MPGKENFKLSAQSRRGFLQAGIGLSAVGLPALMATNDAWADDKEKPNLRGKSLIAAGDTVLFQGDSITDDGRKHGSSFANAQPALGDGYAWLAAEQILVERPEDNLKFYNRGVSGNKVYQLAERWQADCLDLKPNVLSILIGVNDFWHTLDGKYNGTLEKYESDYKSLLKRTKDALPNVKLVVCEPFVIKSGYVNEKWFPAFDAYRAAAKRVADEFAAVFVPYQKMFDTAVRFAPPSHWAPDGVHPTIDAGVLMARWWLTAVGEIAPPAL